MSGAAAVTGGRVRREDRRAQILAEAIRIIGRRGYYGFSVQELADGCGLTVAGVLHHVGTKEKLLIALLEERDRRDTEAVIEQLEQELGRAPTVADARRALRTVVARNRTQPEIVRLHTMLRSESLYREHPAHEYFRNRETQVLDAFTRLVEGLGLPGAPRSVARHLIATMTGLEEQWLRCPDDIDLVAEWDQAVARILPASSEDRIR
ncbi:TetR/AcrR family transcriptional regulator [Nocardia sp. CA2R105]|uniref:TetR/AcrR family transcriptional regulator n=1 Tax=Nocardia coffeae TaxID=2873381 RepID=UPI001CA6C5E9|nr:TetR/AcrR family transcriptional regulator [Nocardia coffeae]MBY8861802.1 TetR/AcrR family transcriptional regulator [Nocardia coffeae]